ncbi:RHTO0S09e07646g1_1 [Rhodotorula toruloides]|uniref:RHTO0S09e07646g1_1 n=1 Tax=Rhodotorula toruloides TaxID=5286 RepID=A0A061B5C7_RHOTO|nr:RHTO0S09e07646g1_1 [Rhodotorula toruloides]
MASEDLTGPKGARFHTREWKPAGGAPARAAVLFVHGFIEHVERYNHVFASFADKGIATFAFDQRGFGKTATYTPKHTQGVTSWPEQFDDIRHFLALVLEKYPSVPVFLFGHSMGGGLVLAYSTRSPPSANVDRLAGVIASSPLLRQAKGVKASPLIVKAGSLIGKLSSTLTLKATVNPEDTCRDPAVQQAYANDPLCKQVGTYRGVADMLLGGEQVVGKDYKRFPTSLPLLVVHGDADKVTDCDSSREFVDKVKSLGAKDATFKSFPGYYHEMHNEPGDDKWVEINFVREWIEQHIPASTSTAATTTTTTTKQPDLPSLEGAAAGSSGASEVPGLASEAGGAEGGDGVGADDAAASAKVQEGRERESKL